MVNEITAILGQLSNQVSAYYSEAQFQYEFASKIAKERPQWSVYLEKKEIGQRSGKTISVDILIKTDDKRDIAIEVKYNLIVDSEFLVKVDQGDKSKVKFHEKERGGRNPARYGFWRDVERLEDFVGSDKKRKGYAIFLTNDSGFWSDSKAHDTVDRDFRIDQGRANVCGDLKWYDQNGRQINEDKKHPPVVLKNTYHLKNSWQIWGTLGFQYLLVEVS